MGTYIEMCTLRMLIFLFFNFVVVNVFALFFAKTFAKLLMGLCLTKIKICFTPLCMGFNMHIILFHLPFNFQCIKLFTNTIAKLCTTILPLH